MKKNIYLVQANPVYSENEKTVYIPYAIGCLAAYAWADTNISSNYELGRFIYTRKDTVAAVASFNAPFLVAFSCSVWNMEYNKAFAKRLKISYPKCLVVFGGHHVSPDTSILADLDFVDILVHGGGEEAFKAILIALSEGHPLNDIANISFRGFDRTIVSTKKANPETLHYPSPYLEGYFDEILKDDIKFSAIIETNRGCPNKCAFCDWGDLKTKVRLFPLEKVERELIWIADKKIEYIYCGDANFGLFERDDKITDLIAALKKEIGFPQRFRVNIAKNITETVKTIIEKFNINSLDKSLPLSYQSLSPTVLRNIGRKNLDLGHFKSLMAFYNQIGVSTSSELIIGLPGETYESFCEGICTLLECGQHKSINVYACELLPNSQLGAPVYKKQHGIESVRLPFHQIHCKIPDNNKDIQEFSEFVVSTNTMSRESWVQTAIFSFYIQALHNLGLTRAIAIYLRYEVGINYLDFYSALIGYFRNTIGSFSNQVYARLYDFTTGVANGRHSWVYADMRFGNLTWGFEELAFLEIVANISVFYREIKNFLKTYCLNGLLEKDLLNYQKNLMKLPFKAKKLIRSEYDFYNYFNRIYTGDYKPLEKSNNCLKIHVDKAIPTWEEYAREIVWLGRRDDAALYSGGRYKISFSNK